MKLTKEQAKKFAESYEWKDWSSAQIALFQLQQERLCFPWNVFHAAVEESLGRPVMTHEFTGKNWDNLKRELEAK